MAGPQLCQIWKISPERIIFYLLKSHLQAVWSAVNPNLLQRFMSNNFSFKISSQIFWCRYRTVRLNPQPFIQFTSTPCWRHFATTSEFPLLHPSRKIASNMSVLPHVWPRVWERWCTPGECIIATMAWTWACCQRTHGQTQQNVTMIVWPCGQLADQYQNKSTELTVQVRPPIVNNVQTWRTKTCN